MYTHNLFCILISGVSKIQNQLNAVQEAKGCELVAANKPKTTAGF